MFIWCLISPRCRNDEYCAHYGMSDWWTCLMGRHPQALMLNAATVEVRSSIRMFTFLPDSNSQVRITVTVSLKTEDPGTREQTRLQYLESGWRSCTFGHLSIKLCVLGFFKLFLSIITSTILSESPLLTIQIICRCFPESLTPNQWALHWCASLWFFLLPPTQPSPNVICYYRNNQIAELPAEMKNLTKLRSIILNYNRYGSISTGLWH